MSTSTETKGGVASYVRAMQETPLWRKWSISHIATHQDGTTLAKVVRFARGALRFWVLLVVRRPSLAHLHTASYGSFARKSVLAWSAKALGVPVVMHVHGAGFQQFHDDAPRLVQRYIRATLRASSAVVALGPSWGRWLQAMAPRALVVVVPNAVPLVPPARPRQVGEPLEVVFLGRVGERKGVPVLLEAWQVVVHDLPEGLMAHLTIAGDGEVDQARATVTERGLDGVTAVLGWVESREASALLDRADVLVLPSQQEGQPMAVLEAMARGVCVVASHVGGIPDLVTDEESGLLVPPDDPTRLAQALVRVLVEDSTRAALGHRARQRVEEEFNSDLTWRTLDRLYADLVS